MNTRANAITQILDSIDDREGLQLLLDGVKERLRGQIDAPTPATLLGRSNSMNAVHGLIAMYAPRDATVLVTGETGTGKELVAREIHARGVRPRGPFVAINCAAVPADLLESELFGHARGAFTDAKSSRKGLLLQADGGTLFLDEIGEMPAEMQAKLLRAIEYRVVRPLGAEDDVSFDARIIAATHRDLGTDVAAGGFRQDLYYRIRVLTVHLPPLRERKDDIELLSRAFLARAAAIEGKDVTGISRQAIEKLVSYDWPGNVRELENVIRAGVALWELNRDLTVEDLDARVREHGGLVVTPIVPASSGLGLTEIEDAIIAAALKRAGGNVSGAARALQVTEARIAGVQQRSPREAEPEPIEDVSDESHRVLAVAAIAGLRLANVPVPMELTPDGLIRVVEGLGRAQDDHRTPANGLTRLVLALAAVGSEASFDEGDRGIFKPKGLFGLGWQSPRKHREDIHRQLTRTIAQGATLVTSGTLGIVLRYRDLVAVAEGAFDKTRVMIPNEALCDALVALDAEQTAWRRVLGWEPDQREREVDIVIVRDEAGPWWKLADHASTNERVMRARALRDPAELSTFRKDVADLICDGNRIIAIARLVEDFSVPASVQGQRPRNASKRSYEFSAWDGDDHRKSVGRR